MFIKQLYTNYLSESAYYIESEGEAAIIDPTADIEEYILMAKERNATIKYIFGTHRHADLVSGHIDLSKATNAPIVYGPDARISFEAIIAKDGEVYSVGKLQLVVLHTPGYTIESTCYLLKDEEGRDHAVFTGRTLSAGDVGRADLLTGEMTREEMAGMLYDSLQSKVVPLCDDVIVYPAPGSGSAETQTIAEQKQTNHLLQQTSKREFIQTVTEGTNTPPNSAVNAKINKESMDIVLESGLTPLTLAEFKNQVNTDAIILDTRNSTVFVQGFIPGSIFIGLEGKFAEWAGSLLPFDKPLLLITEPGQEKETVVRLARVGFSKIAGYLKGGFETWKLAGEKTDLVIEVETDELSMDIPFDPNLVVVDVRKEVEFADGHVLDAVNIPLGNMADLASMANIEDTDNLYLHCGSGFRSLIAASLLKRQGIHNLRNVVGGWAKIKDEPGIKTEKDPAVLN